jgi:hypothetical protein
LRVYRDAEADAKDKDTRQERFRDGFGESPAVTSAKPGGQVETAPFLEASQIVSSSPTSPVLKVVILFVIIVVVVVVIVLAVSPSPCSGCRRRGEGRAT